MGAVPRWAGTARSLLPAEEDEGSLWSALPERTATDGLGLDRAMECSLGARRLEVRLMPGRMCAGAGGAGSRGAWLRGAGGW